MEAETLQEIARALTRIAVALETHPAAALELSRDLFDYPKFDWAAVGAEVIARDSHGAIAVKHNGKVYNPPQLRSTNTARRSGTAVLWAKTAMKPCMSA
ncbi:MAG: hypothetical protein HC895_08220 [Leptolyngbyaceae cyanobacterium SM1_3_5]|nr:hypothetical protein [Leptolyngbyaceae cyanobacterium SM1_3_5]